MRKLKLLVAGRIWRFLKYWGEDSRLQQMPSIIAHYRAMGITIGQRVQIYHTKFDPIYPQFITIGDDVTITNAVILTHDDSATTWIKKRKVAPVKIGNRVFIGWGSIILPGVTIGDDCVIGAGSLVTRDVPLRSVVAGNPAKIVKSLDDFVETARKHRDLIDFTVASALVTEEECAAIGKLAAQIKQVGR